MAISDLAAAVRTVSDASRPALMLPCENVRFVLFAIVLSVVVCAFSMPAAADDRNVCFDQTSPPDIGVTSCSAVISLSKLKDRDLITAYNRRGYFYLKKGEPDRALADLSEAIRLDQNGGLWTFLAANWAIMIGGIGAAVGWYLTYRGWAVGYNNAIDLERRKAKLQFVSDQIRYLYGPLMALCRTRRAAFDVLMKDHGKDRKNFFDYNKRTAEELRQWRLWRTEVLMPIVEKMQESILQNAHLIEEKTPARAKHPPVPRRSPA